MSPSKMEPYENKTQCSLKPPKYKPLNFENDNSYLIELEHQHGYLSPTYTIL